RAAELGVDVLALEAVLLDRAAQTVDAEPVRVVRPLAVLGLERRVVDDEVDLRVAHRGRPDVARVGVDAVEAGQREALVRADQRLAELDALLDERPRNLLVVEPPALTVRSPRRIALPAVVAVLLADPLHHRGLQLPAVVRRDL